MNYSRYLAGNSRDSVRHFTPRRSGFEVKAIGFSSVFKSFCIDLLLKTVLRSATLGTESDY